MSEIINNNKIFDFFNDAEIKFYLKDDLSLAVKANNSNIPKKIIDDFTKNTLKFKYYSNDFSNNYYLQSLLQYSEFRKIFIILIKFLNNYQNDLNINLSLSQELSKILILEPYSINQITLIVEYIKHYDIIIELFPSLFNYLNNIKKFYQYQLWPVINKIKLPSSKFLKYYLANYQTDRYLERYRYDNRIFNITFLENKFSLFTYYLTQKFIEYINNSKKYYHPQYIKGRWKSEKIVLYRGIHSKLAKDIMKLQKGDFYTFEGFQSQSYSYFQAEQFSFNYIHDISKEMVKFAYHFTKEDFDYNIKDNVKDNIGMVLHLKYPDHFKFLCFNSAQNEILTYPNSRYQFKNIYFNNFGINCDLKYLDYDISNIKINLFDFDWKFIAILKYLDYYFYYVKWFILYNYFLENIELMNEIIRKNNLEVIKINLNDENYLEEFEDYINSISGLEKDLKMAFRSNFNNIKSDENQRINIEDKLSSEIIKNIRKYIVKYE